MKLLVGCLLLAAVLIAADTPPKDTESAIPQPIAEMKLSNGKTFKNITIVRYDREHVVVKISGGAATPFAYTLIAEPLRGQMIAERDSRLRLAKAAATKATKAEPRTLTGQVYITTRGAGSYKFSEATVSAYPKSRYEQIAAFVRVRGRDGQDAAAWIKELADEKTLARATTDAEGRYMLKLPIEYSQVFLFAMTTRLVGGRTEVNLWAIPVPDDAATFDLNGSNSLL